MHELNQTIGEGFARRYEELAAKVDELSAPLSDEQFWTKPFAFGNSFGHLVLHLTGNLNYYIGAEIAGTGYVRDRDREFTEAARPTKKEVMRRFDDAVALVMRTARAQTEADWAKAYTAMREEDADNRFNIFLRCASHLHHHVGQMMYLQKELMRDVGSENPL
jgi:DNA-binding IclR family transcriptional regulator